MPFDLAPPRAHAAETPAGVRARRRVAMWLFAMCAMLVVMIALGGATRLTGSGLSIMEWAPLSGALPPWSEAEWTRLFTLYQRIPQYHLVNEGFGLDGFKHIFWLEWTHRLWGRAVGVAFLVPLIVFAWRGDISRRMLPGFGLLFVLGGLQGAVGWFMVASGFEADTASVEPVRLVAHLAMALALYAALFWMAVSLWRGRLPRRAPGAATRLAWLSVAAAALTALAGGFVAGLHAGRIYNSFPLMGGRLVPDGYAALAPFWRNLVANPEAVQFDHRVLATLTAAIVGTTVVAGLARATDADLRRALIFVSFCVSIQYTLGVATLLTGVYPGLAVAHQVVAVGLLTACLLALHLLRRGSTDTIPGRAPAVSS